MNKKVLMIGATGMLGESILHAMEGADLELRVLIRPGKPDVDEHFRSKGIDVFHGDTLKPETLQAAVRDVDTIVCTLHNDPDVFVPGHQNLIEAAESAGVKRFVPSDFAVDYFKIKSEENFNLALRHKTAAMFEGKKVRPIHILIGGFMDTMFDRKAPFINWNDRTLPYFGDGTQACDYTSVADAGRYVVAAIQDDDAPEVLRFAGDVQTGPGMAESIAKGTGEPMQAISYGSIEQLAELIESKKKSASNPWEWIALQYAHNMFSGRAKLEPLDNERYRNVQPQSLETFARRNKNVEVQGMGKSMR